MQRQRHTHYQVLGLSSDVTASEIKRAYRKLVKSLHPDLGHHEHSEMDRNVANERMMQLNEAYETLMDRAKRKEYDCAIGLFRGATFSPSEAPLREDEWRERYIRTIFNPARSSVSKVLNRYSTQLLQLSQDIYDEELLATFEQYVDEVEDTLHKSANALSQNAWPRSLDASVQMMRYAIAQAADGLEEMRRFCQNFDYDHLSMAQNLFRIAQDLSRQSAKLLRV
jgi:molecular chaperone DnaJ